MKYETQIRKYGSIMEKPTEEEVFASISPHIAKAAQTIILQPPGIYAIYLKNEPTPFDITVSITNSFRNRELKKLKNGLLKDNRPDIYDYLCTAHSRTHTILWVLNDSMGICCGF